MGDYAMAALLRHSLRAAPLASRALHSSAPTRAGMYAFSPVKTDPKVEAWASHREDIEESFEYNSKTNARLLLFGAFIPLLIYKLAKDEFEEDDAKYGRDKEPTSRGNTRKYL